MSNNAIFTFLFFTFLHFSLEGSSSLGHNKMSKVRILNWWNYLDERVTNDLLNKGFELDISIYHSNEVALSRLLSKRDLFDLAIVSNINLDLLLKQGVFDAKILNDLVASRPYFRHLIHQNACVPYLWGTTIFAIDGRENFGQIPRTLDELKKLKSKGVKIGVLDDPFEMSARILADNIERCPKKNFKTFFSNIGSCGEAFSESKLGFSPEDFVTTSDEFLLKEKIAVYAWQGSVFMNLKKAPWLKFGLPLNHPVIGADYICVLKNNNFSKEKKKMLLNLVQNISNKKNTTLNVESSQYFSPYLNDFSGLNPLVLKLYSSLRNKIGESEPVFLTTPSKNEHKEINSWWKKVRYETK